MNRHIIKNLAHRHLKVFMCLLLAAFLTACGGGGEDADSGTGSEATGVTISGSVGDGPIVGADITVSDSNGATVTSTTSNTQANYTVDVPPGTSYPLLVSATDGTDTVTGAPPVFEMLSIVLDSGSSTININPFTTLIVKTAQSMPGGLTAANITTARSHVLEHLNFGLDPALYPDAVTTPVNPDNAANVVKSSEALAEAIRRIRTALLISGIDRSEASIIQALARDLADGDLDGQGAGADARVSATAWIVSGQVLVEVLANTLAVEGADATDRLDTAIQLTMPNTSRTTADVVITEAVLKQSKAALNATQNSAPSTALTSIADALDNIPADSLPADASAVLPSDASDSFLTPILVVVSATDGELEQINSSAIESLAANSGSDSGGTTEPVSISNTTPSSYQWGTLSVGEAVYIDRSFSYTAVPAYYVGLRYLRTRNDDKGLAGNSIVSFDIDQPTTVYVAHDTRISTKPAWLVSWTDTGDNLVSSDTTLRIYRKDFAAGTVTLGANGGSGYSMYTVVVDSLNDEDRDGMADDWESANGLDPQDPDDGASDSDGDGFTNLEEYQGTSDPNDDGSLPDQQPVARNDNATTNQDTPVNIAVLDNDSGLANGPLSVSISGGGPANGSAAVNADNSIRYTPSSGSTGTDSFLYEITDADGDTAIASVSVEINCTNGCAAGVTVSVEWNPNTSSDQVTEYSVFLGPTETASGMQQIDSLSVAAGDIDPTAPAVSYDAGNDLGLQVGDQACFRLKASNSAGTSSYSPAACGTI